MSAPKESKGKYVVAVICDTKEQAVKVMEQLALMWANGDRFTIETTRLDMEPKKKGRRRSKPKN